VCNLLAPSSGGLSFLAPIQQALTGASSAFNCSSQMAAFNALQNGSSATTVPTPGATSGAAASGSAAATQAYGIVGQPDTSKTTGLGGLINQLLGVKK
jgi:hypothetical protein